MNPRQQPSGAGTSRSSSRVSAFAREAGEFLGFTVVRDGDLLSSLRFLPEFLNLLVLFSLMFFVLAIVVPSAMSRSISAAAGLALAYVLGWWLNKRGRGRLAAIGILTMIFVVVSLMAFTAGGIYAPSFMAYPIIVLAAGLLLGARATWIATCMAILMGIVLERWATGEDAGWRLFAHTRMTYLVTMSGLLLTFTLTILLYLRSLARVAHQANEELRERRRVAAQLAASEAMLSTILDSTKDYILATDRHLRITAVNKPLREFLLAGLEIVARPGDPVMDVIEPSRRGAVGDVFRRVLAGESLALIHERSGRDGRRFYLVESYSPIVAPDGSIDGITIYTRDMSDWIRMDQALRESEERFRTVVTNVPVIMFALDAQGVFRLSEGKGLESLGMRPGQVVGRSAFDVYAAYPEIGASIRRALAGEAHVMTAEVEGLSFETYYAPVMGSDGAVAGIIGVATDITQQRRSMEKLREQASLMDRAHDAIFVRDLEGRISFWNREAERLYGWTAAEALGRNDAEITCVRGQEEKLQQAFTTTVAYGEWNGELLQRTRAGREVLVDSRWSLITDDAGKPRSILSINIDITEKKSLERQLLQSQRLESLGTLAGGIAHDLNNILTPILMSVDALRQRHDDPRTRKTLDAMESGAQRGADILRQLLTFARGVKGEHLPVRPADVVREIERIMRSSFPKSIDIHIQIDPDLHTVLADATQLHQVLLNLCVNARDAIGPAGLISVTGGNVLLTEADVRRYPGAAAGSFVQITVSDNGCGISKEHLEKIFDPFFTTKEIGKGTGLGLSTVLTIIKNHGGFLDVFSEVGRGTTFRISLPAAASDHVAETTKPAEMYRGHNELIMVVDDEQTVREVAAETLEMAGYRVLSFSSGESAAEYFGEHRGDIALVITDVMMAGMDGAELVRRIRLESPALPMLAMSGMIVSEKLTEMSRLGVARVLSKPFTSGELLHGVALELAAPSGSSS